MTPYTKAMPAYPGRFPCREVRVGDTVLGPGHPVRLQSMTTTDTTDVKASIKQCIRLFDAGADYVRIGIPNRKALRSIPAIKHSLREAGYGKPLIADIHFSAELSVAAAPLFEKIRINPGNFTDKPQRGQKEWTDIACQHALEQIHQKLLPLVKVCKEYGTAIRIGSNFGSLSDRIIWQYGHSPEALVASTLEFLHILQDLGFYQTVVSLKASDPLLCVQSYHLMAKRMLEEHMAYPMHLGITEAGEGEDARIKSSLGISTLLNMGIGDTIRVSLSEEPEAEIPVAKAILNHSPAKSQNTPQTKSYRLPSFRVRETCPSLPGHHKAVLIEHMSHRTAQDEEGMYYAVPYDQWDKQAHPDIFPLFSQEEITESGMLFHPKVNLLTLKRMPAKGLFERLKLVPGLMLVVEHAWSWSPDDFEELHRRMTEANMHPCCLAKVTCSQGQKEDPGISLAADLGNLLLQRLISGIYLDQGTDPSARSVQLSVLSDLLHVSGLRITRTTYISCPTCTRTSFDLRKVVREVKALNCRLPGIRIAVMGCVVNGPGEMQGADFGIVGSANGKTIIYKGAKPCKRNIDPENAAAELMALLKSEGLC
jgi:(E)-4-hydroxy-3-methylbut-2-enyl-diphosphate synthase